MPPTRLRRPGFGPAGLPRRRRRRGRRARPAAGQPDPERIATHTVVWAAGVQASSFARRLADASGASTDGQGRIRVHADLTLPGHPEVFAIGDMASVADGGRASAPGVAPVAIQQGAFVARKILRVPGRSGRGGSAIGQGQPGDHRARQGRRAGRPVQGGEWPPGRCGSWCTSSTWWASRTGCS